MVLEKLLLPCRSGTLCLRPRAAPRRAGDHDTTRRNWQQSKPGLCAACKNTKKKKRNLAFASPAAKRPRSLRTRPRSEETNAPSRQIGRVHDGNLPSLSHAVASLSARIPTALGTGVWIVSWAAAMCRREDAPSWPPSAPLLRAWGALDWGDGRHGRVVILGSGSRRPFARVRSRDGTSTAGAMS